MEKREKRIRQIVNHLKGTRLPLSAAMTEVERDDYAFCRDVMKQIEFTHGKWNLINVPA